MPELQHDAFVPSYADFLEKTHHNVWIGSSSSSTEGVPVDHAKKPGTVGKLHFDPCEVQVIVGSSVFRHPGILMLVETDRYATCAVCCRYENILGVVAGSKVRHSHACAWLGQLL